MSNDFDTLKDKVKTLKGYLARFEPARNVSPELVLDSGTTYTATMAQFNFTPNKSVRPILKPMIISQVQVSGVAYALVSGAPSSGEYSYSESTRLFTINLGAALSTQIVTVFHYLFFSSDIIRATNADPLNSSETIRTWFPRATPSIKSSQDQLDVSEGFISFADSSINISNEDGFFEQFLGDEDSFSLKSITVWSFLDDVTNISRAFRGFTNSVSIGLIAKLTLFDEFSLMNQKIYSNDTFAKSTYNADAFPSIHPDNENAPIRRVFNDTSLYKEIDDPTSAPSFRIDPTYLLPAVCTVYTKAISNTVNRVWGCHLAQGTGGDQTDTIAAIDDTNPTHTIITHGAGKIYKVGSTLWMTPGNEPAIVLQVIDSTNIKVTKNSFLIATMTITRPGIDAVVVRQQGIDYYAINGRDYTVSHSGNANDIIEITFVNNFEGIFPMPDELNPDTDTVKFRAIMDPALDFSHGTVIDEILDDAGFTVNAASITAANLTSIDTNFNIPFGIDSNFPLVFDVLQKFVNSTVSFLAINNDLEIEYVLFDAPSPSASEKNDDREIMKGTFTTDIDYNDIVDTISFSNDHEVITTSTSNAPVESLKARYLHGVKNDKTINHIMKTFSRAQTLIDILGNRKARYQFRTKLQNLKKKLGDDLTIDRSKLIGNPGTRDAKILSITKELTEVELILDDLIGL